MLIMERQIDRLSVHVFDTRQEMGKAAADAAAKIIRTLIARKGEANIVFASAPSQNELLSCLLEEDIDWRRLRGFYQDEYIGLPPDSPAGFGNFLRRNIFDRKPFMELHFLDCTHENAAMKIAEYTALLQKHSPDLIFLGVGENGHMAFNEPHVADFQEPRHLMVVELDATSRMQQVHDGCFTSFDEVPTHAITLTMSQILSIPNAMAVVPTSRKEDAVDAMLNGPVSAACPASALRLHPTAKLFLDKDSAGKGLLQYDRVSQKERDSI